MSKISAYPHEPEYRAIVGAVRGIGDRRYAVSYLEENVGTVFKDTDVTFSLDVWEGDDDPQQGQVVLLARVERFVHGWRAGRARPITLQEAVKEKEQEERRRA